MSLKTKILFASLILLCLGLLGVAINFSINNANLRNSLNKRGTDFSSMSLKYGRAKARIGSLDKKVRRMSSKIRKDIKKYEGLATKYGELEARYKTKISKKPLIIDKEKERVIETIKENGIESLPFAYKDFRIDIDGDAIKGILGYSLHQNFLVRYVEIKSRQEVNHYVELFELDNEKNIVGQLEVERFDLSIKEERKQEISWFNPKLDLSFTPMIDFSLRPNLSLDLGLSLSTFGYTKKDISWRLLRLGVNFNQQELNGSFSPFSYNVASLLPIVDNIWIGPFVVGPHFQVGFGIGAVF